MGTVVWSADHPHPRGRVWAEAAHAVLYHYYRLIFIGH